MVSQGSSTTAAEKVVLDGFNTKLAAKITAWKATVSGVSIAMFAYLGDTPILKGINRQALIYTIQTRDSAKSSTIPLRTASRTTVRYDALLDL